MGLLLGMIFDHCKVCQTFHLFLATCLAMALRHKYTKSCMTVNSVELIELHRSFSVTVSDDKITQNCLEL